MSSYIRLGLHGAVMMNNLEEVENRIKEGGDLNEVDAQGMTALHIAAMNDDQLPIVEKLVKSGANINQMDSNDETPLFIACQYSSENIVKYLLSSDPSSVNFPTSPFDETPLHITFAYGDRDSNIAKLLIGAGADISAKDCNSRTPIFYAVSNKRREATKLLMDAGSDIFLNDLYGDTLLHVACSENAIEIFDLLVEYFAAPHLLNHQNHDGRTPLMEAANCSNLYIVEKLINYGADTSLTDGNGLLALHLVIADGCPNSKDFYKCFELLFKNTPVDVIEMYSTSPNTGVLSLKNTLYPAVRDRSLPCLLLSVHCFEGLSLLFNSGLNQDVISCPKRFGGTLYSPISYFLSFCSDNLTNEDILKYLDLLLIKELIPQGNEGHVSILEAAIRMHKSNHENCICLHVLTRLLEKSTTPDKSNKKTVSNVFKAALENEWMDTYQLLLKHFDLHPEDLVMMMIMMARLSQKSIETPITDFFLNTYSRQIESSCPKDYSSHERQEIKKKEHLILGILKLDQKVPNLRRIARIAVWTLVWKESGTKFLDAIKLIKHWDIPKTLVQFLTCYDYEVTN